VFTARYGLISCIKQITLILYKVKIVCGILTNNLPGICFKELRITGVPNGSRTWSESGDEYSGLLSYDAVASGERFSTFRKVTILSRLKVSWTVWSLKMEVLRLFETLWASWPRIQRRIPEDRVFSSRTYISHNSADCYIASFYTLIKKYLCTWWLQYRKLQVMF
jgi:hypothetical protein